MIVGTAHPVNCAVRVGVVRDQPQMSLSWEDDRGTVAAWAAFSETQAVALALALQSAIDEIHNRRGGNA